MGSYGEFSCPFIKKTELWNQVEIFRQRAWSSGGVPVDVELIAEKQGLDIIPKRDLGEVDAFLTIDGRAILVSATKYDRPAYARRVRFSIAHELGHAVLHMELLRKLRIQSIEEYIEFTRSISDEDYRAFEWQANEFADRLLVPADTLEDELDKAAELVVKHGLGHLIDEAPDQVLARISVSIANVFDVSAEVIELRTEREGLWPPRA